MFNKTYSISLNPNIGPDDLRIARRLLVAPKRWQDGPALAKLTREITAEYGAKKVFLTNAGRSALLLILKSLNIAKGSDILLQSFTCVANINSILWAGHRPVLVDTLVNQPLIDLKDLHQKLTSKSRVLIVQHTFGYPDQMDKITAFCRQHKLILIEDCAHAVYTNFGHKKAGTFGQASFLSFGRDKLLSSVFGGAAVIHDRTLAQAVEKKWGNYPFPNKKRIFALILYPLITELVLSTYGWLTGGRMSVGKLIMWLYQRTGLLPYPVSKAEKQGRRPADFPARMSHAQSLMALNQWQKRSEYADRRRRFLERWVRVIKPPCTFPPAPSSSALLRLPVFLPSPGKLISAAKKSHLILGDWYRPSIAPKGVNLGAFSGSLHCPNAEALSRQVVNLPLCPRYSDEEQKTIVKKFVKVIKNISG